MSLESGNHTKSVNIKVRIYPKEKEDLLYFARKAEISLSELIRRVLLGLRLPKPERYEAIDNIVKVNGDLSRLGNLFKLALDDGRASREKINNLIDGIAEIKDLLKQTVKDIKDGRKS